MTLPTEIHGYAIVSEDDKIAAADGLVPPQLRNEVDWELYQGALANSDLIVFAHRSHDAEPNLSGQRRVVLSRSARGLERREDAWWWNPDRAAWSEVLAQALPDGGEVAVPGGQFAFDLFLRIGYDAFHLSHARGVRLPGGRSLFSACEAGETSSAVLTRSGLVVSQRLELDPAHGVSMDVWRRPAR